MSKLSASIVVLIAVLFLLQAAPYSSPGSPTANDLYIAEIDLIQVTHDPPEIIKNKSAALRLVVISTFSVTVNTEFRITYDFGTKNLTDKGKDALGIPLEPGQNIIYLPGGWQSSAPWWDTDPMTLSWTSTGDDFDLTVTVDPLHRVMETVESNNMIRYTAGVHVVRAQPMRLLVVPVYKDAEGQYEFEEHLDQNIEVLRDQYPVADDGINVTIAPWEHREYEDHNEAADIARSFSDDTRAMGYDRVIVVFKKLYYGSGYLYGRACGMLRDPEDRVPFLVTQVGLRNSKDLLAHELGHTYYLWHPHDIGLELYEADVWYPLERMYDREGSTTMSYDWKLPEGVPSWPRWMDEQRYRTYPKTWIDLTDRDDVAVDGVWEWDLYDQFVRYPVLKAPSVLIRGKLFLDGTAILGDHVQHLASAPRDLTQAIGFISQGNYSLRVLDPSHIPLGTFPFQASFDEMAHWDSVTEVYERRLNEVEFAFSIPEVPGGRYLQLVNETGGILVERAISSHVPEVQVTAPGPGDDFEVGGVLNVSWEGSDADGDDLVYRLAFSADGGLTWVPIADDLTGDSYEWNTSGLRPGSEHLIRVIASDGYNSGEGVSAEFAMVDTTPPVTAISVEGEEGRNGWYVSQVAVSLNATDNDRVERTEYSVDGGDWASYTNMINMTEQGNTSLRYRSIDASGNVEVAGSATIRLDLQGPSLQIIGLANGTKLSEGDIVHWLSSDAVSGVAGHMARVDGVDWKDVGTALQFELSGLAEGQHTLEVKAVDLAGNENSTVIYFSVEVDGSSPLLIMMVAAMVVVGIVSVAYLIIRRRRA